MRGRPSDYDEWDELLRGDNDDPGWRWNDVLPHFRGMEGNNRLYDERHGAEGPLLVSDPGHIDDVSRWFVQSVQALGEPYNHDFNGPRQRGRRLLPVHEPARKAQQRGLRLHRAAGARPAPHGPPQRAGAADPASRTAARSASPTARPAGGERSGLRGRRGDPGRGLARHAAGADAVGHRAGGPAARSTGSTCLADLPGVGENLIDHPEVPIVATATGRHGYYRQGVGWRMLLQRPAVQAVRHRPHPLGRRGGRRLRQPDRPRTRSRPSRPSACRSSTWTATRWGWSRTPTG